MKTKTAPGAAAPRAKASASKSTAHADDNSEDVLQLDADENISATTLTAAEKARHIQAAKAASADEEDDDDMDVEEEDDSALADDDDTLDDDALDMEFAEFDMPKSNRGGKKAGDDDIDEEFRDLGLDGGGGGGLDDDDDDF